MVKGMNLHILPVSLSVFFTWALLPRTGKFSSECGNSNAVLIDGMCLIYDSAKTDWYNARRTCAKYGAQLATIKSAQQIEKLLKFLKNDTLLNFWTGGNDLETEGRYIWDEDKRPVVEPFWIPSEDSPEQGDRDCLYINNERRLKEAICSDLKAALCMYRHLNFAVLQSTFVPGVEDKSTLLPVDGRRSPTDECFKGHTKAGHQSWTLTLNIEKIIHEIIIYRKPKVIGYSHMNGFYVQGYDERGKLLFQYSDTGKNTEEPTVWILTQISLPMKNIVISINNVSEHRYLELCEVEAFGVCTPFDHIKFCYRTCNRVTCNNGECHGNTCLTCARYYKGRCVENRLDESIPMFKILIATVIIMTILTVMLAIVILYFFKYKKEQGEKQLYKKESEISQMTGLKEDDNLKPIDEPSQSLIQTSCSATK